MFTKPKIKSSNTEKLKKKSLGSLGFKTAFSVFALLGFVSFHVFVSFAFFTHTNQAGDNTMSAGGVDFEITEAPWQQGSENSGLLPGDTVTRKVNVEALSSLGFKYLVTTEKTGGNESFCNALNFYAKRDNQNLYSGPLLALSLSEAVTYVSTSTEAWDFAASLPAGQNEYPGEVCEFKFVFTGWQEGAGGSGFTDTEVLENTIVGTGSETLKASISPSPSDVQTVTDQKPEETTSDANTSDLTPTDSTPPDSSASTPAETLNPIDPPVDTQTTEPSTAPPIDSTSPSNPPIFDQ